MSHKPVIVLAVAFSATFLSCSPTQQPQPQTVEPAALSVPVATEPAVERPVTLLDAQAASPCLADRAWLNSATLPSEVPGSQSTCNFEQFVWQSLLALVQPSSDVTTLQFETWMPSYGLFIENGTPTPWGKQPPVIASDLWLTSGRTRTSTHA